MLREDSARNISDLVPGVELYDHGSKQTQCQVRNTVGSYNIKEQLKKITHANLRDRLAEDRVDTFKNYSQAQVGISSYDYNQQSVNLNNQTVSYH